MRLLPELIVRASQSTADPGSRLSVILGIIINVWIISPCYDVEPFPVRRPSNAFRIGHSKVAINRFRHGGPHGFDEFPVRYAGENRGENTMGKILSEPARFRYW